MTVITWTRMAKCKDCRYAQRFTKPGGKQVRTRCSNPESDRYGENKTIRLNDLVCDNWKL